MVLFSLSVTSLEDIIITFHFGDNYLSIFNALIFPQNGLKIVKNQCIDYEIPHSAPMTVHTRDMSPTFSQDRVSNTPGSYYRLHSQESLPVVNCSHFSLLVGPVLSPNIFEDGSLGSLKALHTP